MIHLGTDIKSRTLKKVESRLTQWLDDGEVIVAVFQATRMKPSIQRLILTNRRVLTTAVDIKKISDDIAADKIAEFSLDKGIGKSMKLYAVNNDGTRAYLGVMRKEEAMIINDFLPKMSGTPQPIATKMKERIVAKKAAEETKRQTITTTQKVFSHIGGILITTSLTAALGPIGFPLGVTLWYLLYRNNKK